MDNVLYDIFFRGGVMPGESIDIVKGNLAKLFKANSTQIDAMFSGKAIVIKKNLSKSAALQYQSAMEKAGAKVILREKPGDPKNSKPNPATSAAAKPVTSPPPAQAPTETIVASTPANSAVGDESWDLAPTGSDVLRESERTPFVPADIDTSAIKLTSAFAEPEIDNTPPPSPPNTDHISVAAVGSDILAEKPPEPPKPDIDLSGMEVAPL
ncbi:hypothetical protein A9Q81_03335 [Gammaproteobacteria bacterium 42_54_T18]|nr:hypothetical protein A9Q81_03335 [Gammaproteobacteria bacterium 42_54_T18]